jgi:putative ABC transport system permease protein
MTALTNPFWRKSPLALFHFPGLLGAVAAGAFLLALAAASPALFISAASSAALKDELADTTRYGAGASVAQNGFAYDPRFRGLEPPLTTNAAVLRRALASAANVDAPVFTLESASVTPARSPQRPSTVDVRPLARTGALDHIAKVAGQGDDGFWIAATVAESIGVRPGDEITLLDVQGRSAKVRIAGLYRPLYSEPSTPYWRSLYQDIYPRSAAARLPPPTFLIGSADDVAEIARRLRQPMSARAEWPLATSDLTLEQAEHLAGRFERFSKDISDPGTPIGRALFCTRCRTFRQPELVYDSLLPLAISEARRTVTTLRGPADLLATAGILVALAVVAAAGAFAMARRRVEARLLFTRGTSPFSLGIRAALESVAPVLIGAAAGLGAAVLIVALAGPEGGLERRGIATAAALAALVVPVAAAVIAVVSSLSFARHSETATARVRQLARLPWELAVLGLAAYFLQQLRTGGAFIGDVAEGTGRPSLALLLFPLCFIAGFASLATRLLTPPLRWLRGRAERWPDAAYLAIARLAAARRLALLLIAASALSLGIFVYAQSLVRSFERAVEVKSLVFVGSDVAGVVGGDSEPLQSFPFPITKVSHAIRGGELGGVQADLLAIDPETFAHAAYWEPGWASRPLTDLVGELDSRGEDRLPVIVAGRSVTDTNTLGLGAGAIPIRVVERARVFPGMFLRRPLVVVDADALDRFARAAGAHNPFDDPGTETSFWVKGETRAAARALQAEARPYTMLTAEEARHTPTVRAVTNTFAFLKALGLGAGCLAVVGLVLYLQARQRSRVVSYTLSRRMGLGHRRHLVSLLLELGAMLMSSLAIGALLGMLAARFVVADVDPRPRVPPTPLFEAPWPLLATALAFLLAAAFAGSALANRLARRANAAEVMRVVD